MSTTRRIIIYGNTLALAGITLALQRQSALKVMALEFDEANLAQQIKLHSPNVIIFDQSQTDVKSILTCTEHDRDLLAIGLEADDDRMTLWSEQSARALTMQDLVQTIEALPDRATGTADSISNRDQYRSVTADRTKFVFTRTKKLIFASVVIGLSFLLVLMYWLSTLSPPLAGTASNWLKPEVLLAFATGLAIGVLVVLR